MFGPLKTRWSSVVGEWQRESAHFNQVLRKRDVPGLLRRASGTCRGCQDARAGRAGAAATRKRDVPELLRRASSAITADKAGSRLGPGNTGFTHSAVLLDKIDK